MGGQKITEYAPEMWAEVQAGDVDPRIFKRVSLGSGAKDHSPPHFLRLDSNPEVEPDILHDLNIFPWPFEDSSVHEIFASNIFEHIADQIPLWNEIWRVCANGAKVTVLVPHRNHDDAWADPTHKFFFTERFFHYLTVPGRVSMGVESYSSFLKCDFDIVSIQNFIEPIYENYSYDAKRWAIVNQANVIKQMKAHLLAKKPVRAREEVIQNG